MAVEELLKHVPADAVYHRVPLSDDQNALGPWQEAIERYVPPDEDDPLWGQLIYGAGENGTPVAFPNGSEGERLRALLARNQAALQLLEEGIRRGRLQLPEQHPGDNAAKHNGDFVFSIHHLSQMLWVKAKSLRGDNDVLSAWQVPVQLLRMGEMLCNGEGLVTGYLIGHGIRKGAVDCIRGLAGRTETPRAVLMDLLSAANHSLVVPDGLGQSMRVEFCYWILVKLDRTPEGSELERLVDSLLSVWYDRGFVSVTSPKGPQFVTPSDDRLAWRREQAISVLCDHPCPFDKIATVRRMGELVAAQIRSLNYLRRTRICDFGHALRSLLFSLHWRRCWRRPRGMRYWPAQLTPEFPVEWLGPSEEAHAELAEVGQHMSVKDLASSQPPTETDIGLCRRKLRRVHNPIGWMLIEYLFLAGPDVRWTVVDYRTALEEMQKLVRKRLRRGTLRGFSSAGAG
jgi:hypothetical protein